jgi:hypothetical protein
MLWDTVMGFMALEIPIGEYEVTFWQVFIYFLIFYFILLFLFGIGAKGSR